MQGFKLHHLCWLSIGFILLQGWIAMGPEIELTLASHNYVVNRITLVVILSLIFVIFGIIYRWISPFRWQWTFQLGLLQIGFALVAVVIISIIGRNFKSIQERADEMSPEHVQGMLNLNTIFSQVALFIMGFSFLLFLGIIIRNVTLQKTNPSS